MTIDYNNNRFINLFNDVYEKANDKEFNIIDTITTGFGIFKNTVVLNNAEKVLRNQISDELNKFNADSLYFPIIWEFCQFVRYAEMVIFYKNTIDNIIYVDSAIDNIKERKFSMKIPDNNDAVVYFTLEKLLEEITKDVFKVMKITVDRNYGKLMRNEFTIVDDTYKYFEIHEVTLIKHIYKLLYDAICDTVLDVMDNVLSNNRLKEIHKDNEFKKAVFYIE